jgi:hypothetical protein
MDRRTAARLDAWITREPDWRTVSDIEEQWGQKDCDVCGEELKPNDEVAEMYDPEDDDGDPVICHAQCGLDKGLEIA